MDVDEESQEDRFQLNQAAEFVRRARTAGFDIPTYKVEFDEGSWIFREGDLGDAMYVILEGEVLILKKLEDGSSRVLHVMKKGDFFGEMSLIDKQFRSASAQCQTRVTLVRIPEGHLVRFIESHPEFVIRMLNTFVERLRNSNKIIEGAMARNPHAVVLAGLREFARHHGTLTAEGTELSVPGFSSWSHYRLGIPESQIPGILVMLVEDGVLVLKDMETAVLLI